MEYFFRHQEDGITSINMTFVRVLIVLAIFLAIKYRRKENLLKVLLILGVFFQGLLFFWYYGDKNLFITEGLPFYHCRIAALMMPIFYFNKNERYAKYFAFLGIIGSLIAVLFPDPSKYLWPHVTNLTYVGAHFLLMMNGVMIVTNSSYNLSRNEIISTTLVMNLIISIANSIFSSNYAYLSSLPSSMHFTLSKISLFALCSLLIVGLISIFENRQKVLCPRFLEDY